MLHSPNYEHLLNIRYREGIDDCYGLSRRYYRDVYGVELRNAARPLDIFFSGIDLVGNHFKEEGFDVVNHNFRDLQVGDGLCFCINNAPVINHVGVFVGNNQFLHLLYQQTSRIDNLSDAWKRRIVNVLRHPFVTEQNSKNPSISVIDLLPPHVRHRILPNK